MLDESTIAKLEARGFNRWTKGHCDRLYVKATAIGLEVEYYGRFENHGRNPIKEAHWKGKDIGSSDGRRMKDADCYIDVKDETINVSAANKFCLEELTDALKEILEETKNDTTPAPPSKEDQLREEALQDFSCIADRQAAVEMSDAAREAFGEFRVAAKKYIESCPAQDLKTIKGGKSINVGWTAGITREYGERLQDEEKHAAMREKYSKFLAALEAYEEEKRKKEEGELVWSI